MSLEMLCMGILTETQMRRHFCSVNIVTHYEKFPVSLNVVGGRKHFTSEDCQLNLSSFD